MTLAMSRSTHNLWTPLAAEDDWTQVGDPVKRRQIQNRISKRRQRERLRQQKAKDKEAQAYSFERMMNHSNARRNSSGTSTSSPTRFDQVYPRWRGHSMPPGTVTYSDWTGRPSGYEISHNAIRHHEVPAPNYASLPQSTLNSASSSSSAPATYWPQPTAVPSIHSQCPPTSYPDQPRSPGPYKSSALTRHNTAPEHGSQMAWPSAEVKDQSSVVRNLEFRRDVHQEPPVSHLPYTTQAYGSSETTSSMPVTTSEPIEERFNAIMPYSQSLAYPAYQPVLADYYGRYSP